MGTVVITHNIIVLVSCRVVVPNSFFLRNFSRSKKDSGRSHKIRQSAENCFPMSFRVHRKRNRNRPRFAFLRFVSYRIKHFVIGPYFCFLASTAFGLRGTIKNQSTASRGAAIAFLVKRTNKPNLRATGTASPGHTPRHRQIVARQTNKLGSAGQTKKKKNTIGSIQSEPSLDEVRSCSRTVDS